MAQKDLDPTGNSDIATQIGRIEEMFTELYAGAGGGGSGGGLELIEGDTITPAQSYVDIDLPAGYVAFRLFLYDVSGGANAPSLACWLSEDGGATFPVDWDNWDIYSHRAWSAYGGFAPANSTSSADAVLNIGRAANEQSFFEMSIDPGAADRKAIVVSKQYGVHGDLPVFSENIGHIRSVGTQNLIRIGDSDELYAVDTNSGSNPPNPRRPVSLSYKLYGVPA